jgi:hypothetical protein
MSQTFTKQFNSMGQFVSLPNNSYWLSREEAILSYLHQRNAPVPKVQLKNLLDNELVLENVGHSLADFFKKNDSPSYDEATIIAVVLNTIISLESIFNLGVLHLDIALRNIATSNIRSENIFILDFSHALSQHNQLQKPLPLIPTEGLHHPLLINSLSSDWENYFAYFSIRNQKIDSTLVISNEEFTEYWPQSLSVQDLSTNKAVLCHGIANLLNEFSIALSYSNALNEYLLETSQKLRFLEEDDANFVLSEVINDLKNKKKSLVAINTEGTPIPSISFNAKEKHVEEGLNNTNAISLNSQINIAKKKNLRDIQSKITNQSYRTLSEIALEIPIWALIFLNGWWINLIIEVAKIRLSDNLIIALVISFFIFTILFFTSFFINPPKNIFFRMSALLIICLTELMTILSFISIISPHLWLWIPSATILSAASFFLIFKIIQNIKKLSS